LTIPPPVPLPSPGTPVPGLLLSTTWLAISVSLPVPFGPNVPLAMPPPARLPR
jgi:hypothetical protein